MYLFFFFIIFLPFSNIYSSDAIKITAKKIKIEKLTPIHTSQAKIIANKKIDFKAHTYGIIEAIYTSPHDTIIKDEIILAIDKENTENTLKVMKENFELAQKEYEKNKELFATKLIDPSVVEKSFHHYIKSLMQLKLTERDYDLKIIKAPFDGVISTMSVKEKDTVKLEDLLFSVTDPREGFMLEIYLPSKYFKYISLASKIYLEGKKVSKIIGISPMIDPDLKKFKILASIDNSKVLYDGEYLETKIHISAYNAKLVPKSSIITTEDNNYVFIIRDNIAYKTLVELGEESSDYIEIISNQINSEDLVAVKDLSKLEDGSLVKLK